MTTAVITIGLNSNRTLQPLADEAREAFVASVRRLLDLSGAIVHVDGAASHGTWTDEATGSTVHEEARTWVAALADDPLPIGDALRDLAAQYEQDAIACTIGETYLVSAHTSDH